MNIVDRKKQEDLRREKEGKIKLEELKERMKLAKKQGRGGVLSSYDSNGRAVSVQIIQKFPNIAPKCGQVTGEPEISKQEIFANFHLNSPRKRATRGGTQQSFKTLNSQKDTVNVVPVVIHKEGAVYESIKPSEGVTFAETGKDPKANKGTIGEKSGRLTKTQFYSILGEASLKMSGSLPSFFTNLIKPQSESGSYIQSKYI